jgi:hypothetical protein
MPKNMKKSLVILIISIFCISCEKTFLIPDDEVPGWLKERILEDEKIIKSDPKLMQNYGAWIRYEFKGDMYYEYDNPLSSESRSPYSQDGVRMETTITPFTEYEKDKCCERFIWKAPKYHDLK